MGKQYEDKTMRQYIIKWESVYYVFCTSVINSSSSLYYFSNELEFSKEFDTKIELMYERLLHWYEDDGDSFCVLILNDPKLSLRR